MECVQVAWLFFKQLSPFETLDPVCALSFRATLSSNGTGNLSANSSAHLALKEPEIVGKRPLNFQLQKVS